MPAAVAILLGVVALALSVATFLFVRSHVRAVNRELHTMARQIDALAEGMSRHLGEHGRLPVATNSPEPVREKPQPDRSTHRVDRAEAPPSPTLIAVPNLAASEGEAPELAAAELAQRYAALWDLAEAGASADSIARTTGQPVGQVELILGLKRHAHDASAIPRS